MSQNATEILDRVKTWPQEDREELAEMARAIEARRTGLYELSSDEEKDSPNLIADSGRMRRQ